MLHQCVLTSKMIQKNMGLWLEMVPGRGWNFTPCKEDRASSFQVSHTFHWRLCIPDTNAQNLLAITFLPHGVMEGNPSWMPRELEDLHLNPHSCFLPSEKLKPGPRGSLLPPDRSLAVRNSIQYLDVVHDPHSKSQMCSCLQIPLPLKK